MKPYKLLQALVAIILIFGMNSFAAGTGDGTAKQGCPQSAATHGDNPMAPSALTLSRISAGFLLKWTPSVQDRGSRVGFEIVRASSISGPYVVVGTVTNGANHFRDTTAAPENIYYYKVRAIVGDRYSPYSKPAAGELIARPGQ